MKPEDERCHKCLKPQGLCICDAVKPLKCKTQILILQHPQEPDFKLGSAKIVTLALPASTLAVGLSWPNLKKALGREANPKEWAVLYLGNAKKIVPNGRVVHAIAKDGKALEETEKILKAIRGIIAIDGTWSQAKTIWWRNAWLNKLQRIALTPKIPSIYGKLRREPKRESLSTLEAIGNCLSELENNPEILKNLLVPFRTLLQRARDLKLS